MSKRARSAAASVGDPRVAKVPKGVSPRAATASAIPGGGHGALARVLKFLGSLRLTVVLLGLGMFLVLTGTLQQARRDVWDVLREHFPKEFVFDVGAGTISGLVYVPFQTFFPPAWAPEWQDIQGGFWVPSGLTVIVLMLVNLAAAHLRTLRVQARGRPLVAGLAVVGLGIALTILVIAGGQNSSGFQIERTNLLIWTTVRVGLAVITAAAVVQGLRMRSASRWRRTTWAIGASALGALTILVLATNQQTLVGQSPGMRILWQLIQGATCGGVLLVGGWLLFRRKAGIALIHSGLAFMMLGQLYTTYFSVEQRMSFFEGETASHTIDVRATELAVIRDVGNDRQDVITVPASMLQAGDLIDHPDLPFQIQPLVYYVNSEIEALPPGAPSLATRGLGLKGRAVPLASVTGTDPTNNVNFASVYVRLIGRGNDAPDLGTYMLSQYLHFREQLPLDRVTVGDETYEIALRFKHYYKPYSVTLLDASRSLYVGTNIEQSFASEFRLDDPQAGVEGDVKKIWMNNPLRYRNETFYQAGYENVGGREHSVLQIVRNVGWMIPYVSSMIILVGLVGQFLLTVSRARELARPDHVESPRARLISMGVSVGLVLMLAAMAAAHARPKPLEHRGMRLDWLGQLPVTYGGRIQPLDSVARSTLRQLRERETALLEDERVPAIRWLADVMFEADGWDEYRVFKITDPEILQDLRLDDRRKSHAYSMAELDAQRDEINRLVARALDKQRDEPDQLTNFDRRILKLSQAIELHRVLRLALGNPAADRHRTVLNRLAWAHAMVTAENLPHLVPPDPQNPDSDWQVLAVAAMRSWIPELAQTRGTRSIAELATHLIDSEFDLVALRQQVEREMIARQLMAQSSLRESYAHLTEAQLLETLTDLLANDELMSALPPELAARIDGWKQDLKPLVDALVERERKPLEQRVADQIRTVLGVGGDEIPLPDSGGSASQPYLSNLLKLERAYVGDANPTEHTTEIQAGTANAEAGSRQFNDALVAHREAVADNPNAALRSAWVGLESFQNRLAPFTQATVAYIIALIFTLASWVVGPRSFGRIAWTVGLWAWLVHSLGLVDRILISGRPPVTNLYSSAVFIGWAAALVGLILERRTHRGIGNLMTSVMGTVCLLIAFSLSLDGDTMTVLQAVLDTQFWLATHVLAITLGYTATFAAGLIGIVYVVRLVLPVGFSQRERQFLVRTIYGVTCFAMVFSFLGTVLGGLWADDSWGRFWGWDPKENGALLIVLSNALVLHARWGGLVRERGIAVLAILGNIVTAWSWFAVNELGVGLHAYGRSEGRMWFVLMFWLSQLALMIIGALWPARRADQATE